jgi:hypothetical protein
VFTHVCVSGNARKCSSPWSQVYEEWMLDSLSLTKRCRRQVRSWPQERQTPSVSLSLVERWKTILPLNIDVTSSCNEVLRDGLVPFMDRADERRDPFLCLKINVAASFNQLLRVGIFFSFSGKTLIRNLWVTWKARNVAEESTKRYGRDSLCEIYLVRKIRNSWWWYVSICQHTTSTSVYVSLCRHNIPLENVPLYNTLRTLVRSLFLHLNLTDLRYNTHTHHTHTHTHTHIVDNMSIKYMGAVALTILHVNIWVCHYVNSINFCNCLFGERERRASRTDRDGQARPLKKKKRG